MSRKLIVIFVIAVISFGCHAGTSSESGAVREVVTTYNRLLAQGYSAMNMTPLKEAATEDHAEKVYHHMAAFGEAGIKMIPELKDLNFADIEFLSPDIVTAHTVEVWDYVYVQRESGRQVYDNGVTYRLAYRVVREDGRWKVADVSMEEAKEKKEDNFILFQESPLERILRGDQHKR